MTTVGWVTLKGVVNGVGWMVELKLNRKKRKKMDSNGGLRPPLPPSRSATDHRQGYLEDVTWRGLKEFGVCVWGGVV